MLIPMNAPMVITGASSGLGLAMARALAASTHGPGTVVLASENQPANEQAATELATRNPSVVWRPLRMDLADPRSVAAAAVELSGPVGGLVLNAGIYPPAGLRLSPAGLEAAFAVNVVGHVQLLARLGPRLVDGAPVVLVSSASAGDADLARGVTWVEDGAARLNRVYRSGWARHRHYAFTKACLLAYAAELQRRRATGLPVPLPDGARLGTFDPGAAAGSAILVGAPAVSRAAMSSPALLRLFGIPSTTVEVAGEALAAVLLTGLDRPAGSDLDAVPHWQLNRRTPPPAALLEPTLGRRLHDAIHRLPPLAHQPHTGTAVLVSSPVSSPVSWKGL